MSRHTSQVGRDFNYMYVKKEISLVSEETRKKLSEALKKQWASGKRKYHPNSGFKKGHISYITDETREKISRAHKGKPRGGNPENWKHTEETKRKISEAKRGKPNWWMRGKHRSEATKEKLRRINQGRHLSEETKEKIRAAHLARKKRLGYINSVEVREKIRQSHLKRWDIIGRKPKRPRHERSKYINWRRKRFEYDNYTCWICGEKGKKLEAHHLWRWSKYPKLRYKLNNGVTLCRECHRIYTKFGNKH